MSWKKYTTSTEWVTQALAESKSDFIDNHFDIFKDYKELKGLPLLADACKILLEMHNVTASDLNCSKEYKAYICIPLGCHETMMFWDQSLWEKLGEFNHDTPYEPPTGILSTRNILSDNSLEYSCPIELPPAISIAGSKKISAIYCCFHIDQDIQEYNSIIYLYI